MYWILKKLNLSGYEKIIHISSHKPDILELKGLIHQLDGCVCDTECLQSILDGSTHTTLDAFDWFELHCVDVQIEVSSVDFYKAKSPRQGVIGWTHYHSASHGYDTEGFCVEGSFMVGTVELFLYFIRSGEKFYQVIDVNKALRSIVDRFVAEKISKALVE